MDRIARFGETLEPPLIFALLSPRIDLWCSRRYSSPPAPAAVQPEHGDSVCRATSGIGTRKTASTAIASACSSETATAAAFAQLQPTLSITGAPASTMQTTSLPCAGAATGRSTATSSSEARCQRCCSSSGKSNTPIGRCSCSWSRNADGPKQLLA